jgi:hypothetical protein
MGVILVHGVVREYVAGLFKFNGEVLELLPLSGSPGPQKRSEVGWLPLIILRLPSESS